jgi:ABC-type multidrug transport system fused ATPase/permease subunit
MSYWESEDQNRKIQERMKQWEQDQKDNRKAKVITFFLAIIGLIVLIAVFTHVDLVIMSLIGGGLTCLCIGGAAYFTHLFPKFGEVMLKLGSFLMGTSLIVYLIATVFLTLDHAHIVTP